MQRCVIVGGADIGNYGYIREQLLDDDYVVFCDSGLKHLYGHGICRQRSRSEGL